jgi:hypothetical protein
MGGIERKERVKKEGKEWKAGEPGQEVTGEAKGQRGAKAVMGNATIERGERLGPVESQTCSICR